MGRKTKFGIGDKVKIVNYGSLIGTGKNDPVPLIGLPLIKKDQMCLYYDMSPELVGQVGIICERSTECGSPGYAIQGIKHKFAWYNEDQLEMISRNPNR